MISNEELRVVGPYRLARVLEPTAFSQRWLAQHEQLHTEWVVHRFGRSLDKALRVLILSWLETAESFSHPHLPSIHRVEGVDPNIHGPGIWAAEPYLGSEDGLLTVDRLVALKGGRMSAAETERVLLHTLDAMRFAHDLGVCQGPIQASDLLVDRHGSITLDLYGLERRIDGLIDLDEELLRDEIRSVAMIGYWVLTGLAPEEPRIPASRLVRKLDRGWDEWFEVGLDAAGGFATAADALESLPSIGLRTLIESKTSPARSVIERLRTAWASPAETDSV